MSTEKSEGLILRVTDFSETSRIVVIFTREFGKISALAKGGKRLKGPFESALDLLATCQIVFLSKGTSGLDLLTEAKLVHRFRPQERELVCLYAGYYVAELLLGLTEDYDPHPDLYAAYPELSKAVVVQGGKGLGSRAGIVQGKNDVDINVYERGLVDDPRSSMLHEMQHAIQGIEGWAPGGNTVTAFQHPEAHEILQEKYYAYRLGSNPCGSACTYAKFVEFRSCAAIFNFVEVKDSPFAWNRSY